MRVGIVPYAPGINPYQRLMAEAIERTGVEVVRIPPTKWWPLTRASRLGLDVLHIDWPYDFYTGRDYWTQMLKSAMWRKGLRDLRALPVTWTVHNLVRHDTPNESLDLLRQQELLDACSGLHVMSRAADLELRSRYRLPKRIPVAMIPHGHFVGAYPNTVSSAVARRELGLATTGKVVLFLGRVMRYKGLVELIHAFQSVAREFDRLIIAGPCYDQGLECELRKKEDTQVRLHLSEIAESRLQVFFNAADVVALPFKRILNSGSAMLAWSFGKCVVGPAMGSLPEIAPPGALLSYGAAGRFASLVDALSGALSTTDLRASEETIVQFMLDHYSWSSVAIRFTAFLRDVLACQGVVTR